MWLLVLSRVCVHQKSTTMLVSLFCICIRGIKRLILLINLFVESRLGCQTVRVVIEAVQVPQYFIFSRNSVPFCSVPSFGIGSSAELGMPRNGHFLPRNNGIRSESIPRNFFGTKFRSQPYCEHDN
jgi:hypothetical protein